MTDRPVNILVECRALIPSARVGVLDLLAPLETQGKCRVLFKTTVKIKQKDIAWCDILVSVRGSDVVSDRIARGAKSAGRLVVYFLDDDLLNIPRDIASSAFFSAKTTKKHIHNMLSASDILWCVNPMPGTKYRTGDQRMICTRVPATIRKPPELSPDIINIFYAGSKDHENIFRELVSPGLARLCGELGEQISVTVIGIDSGLEPARNIQAYPYMENYKEYEDFINNSVFHIGIGVVGETDFYKCKYYNKFIEYSKIGAAGVYTDCKPYTSVVRNNINGFLCRNTTEAWYQALLSAIKENELRYSCAVNAQTLLAEKFTPAGTTAELVAQLPELVSFHAPEVNAWRIMFFIGPVQMLYYIEVMKVLLEAKGIKAIFEIIYRAGRKIYRKVTGKL